mgnify:CR=1 FL=1
MLKKFIICSDDDDKIKMYNKFFGDFELIEFKKMKSSDFTSSEEFDIKSLPTSFSEKWGSIPYECDCMILSPGNEMSCKVTTIPNFGRWVKNFNKLEQSIITLQIPLYKVIEYCLKSENEMTYGIHDEYSFGGMVKINKRLLKEVRSVLERTFGRYNLLKSP